jgi:hypothetical protein
MRIVSKQKDYYDCMQAYGQEDDILYVRTPRVDKYERPDSSGLGQVSRNWPFFSVGATGRYSAYYDSVGRMEIKNYAVGFCGVVYPCWRLTIKAEHIAIKDAMEFCYNLNHVDTFVEAHCTDKEKAYYYREPVYKANSNWRKYRHNRTREKPLITQRAAFDYCLAVYKEKQPTFAQIFEREDCPIFVSERYVDFDGPQVTYNGNLSQVHFQRVFGPMEAYRELMRWFCTKARPEKPIPAISDLDLAQAKGFNKFSFRKDKSK